MVQYTNVSNDVRIAKMEKDIEFIKESNKSLDKKLDVLMEKIDHHIKDEEEYRNERETYNEKKYAPKYIEKVFWWVLGTVGTALIAAMMALILK